MVDNAALLQQVQHMPQGEFLLATGLLILLCLLGAFTAWMMLHRARVIEDTPTSRIRSAAQGLVELEGTAGLLPGDPVLAPLSGRPCAWWKYSIEKKESSYSNGRRSTSWRTLESKTSDEMFQLSDDTGDCVVDPDGAKVIPNAKLVWYGHSRWPGNAPARSRWIGFGAYRYREQRIEPGSALYALGWFRTEGGIVHGFDTQHDMRELLRQWKQNPQQLLNRFDADGDGNIDMDEWEQVRAHARAEVESRHLEQATHPDLHVLCRPPRRENFLLSTIPQERLIRRSRRMAVFGLFGFFASGSACVWLLSVRGWL